MSLVKSYRDLEVWQESMRTVQLVYQLTRSFPKEELYGLTSQVRRAAVSIPANISEGQARRSRKEFQHHLSIARGSLAELETELQIATQLQYVKREELVPVWESCQKTGMILNGLLRSLQSPRP